MRQHIMRATLVLTLALAGCATSSPQPSTAGPLCLEIYHIQDLVVCSGSAFRGCDMEDHPQGCNRLLASLKSAVPKAPWDEEGWAMVVQNGLLIVRATEPIQQAVLSRLTEVRDSMPREK